MDDGLLILLAVGLPLVAWIVGILGFVSARRALREVAALRLVVEALERAGSSAALAEAPSPPQPDNPPRPFLSPWEPSPAPPAETTPAEPTPLDPPRPDEPFHTEPRSAEPRPNLETLITTRWGIWAGALALLLAGVFLVRYAVEADLLGPTTRCVLAALLGVALIGAGEWLRRRDDGEPVASAIPNLAPAALVGGGVSVLFGAAYGFGPLYGLWPPLVAFVALGGVSLAGLALSLRFGPLVAAIGLVGSYASPVLATTDEPWVPGLYLYLLGITAAALGVVRFTAWVWLGWAATVGAAGWVLLAVGAVTQADAWAPAAFAPAAALLSLLLLPTEAFAHPVGRRLVWVPVGCLGAAALALALTWPGLDTRLGVLALAPLCLWKAAAEPRLRLLPVLPAALFRALLALWDIRAEAWPALVDSPTRWRAAEPTTMLATAALMAGLFAASGVFLQTRAAFPLPWAALAASVPVLTLALCYARVTLFHTRFDWAAAAFALAAGLVALTRWRMRAGDILVAGVYAAGAVAALALGSAMLLADQWLSLAIALMLPPLAWIEARTGLAPLRQVARVVTMLVIARVTVNWHVLDYVFGATPIVNGILVGYFAPALAMAWASILFGRGGVDAAVATLRAGAALCLTIGVALQIRHFLHGGDVTVDRFGFVELGLHVTSLAIMARAGMAIAARSQGRVLVWVWRVQGALALAGGCWLLGPGSPLLGGAVGAVPVLNGLLVAYAVPGAVALWARAHPATGEPPWLRPVLAAFGAIGLFVWVSLAIRQMFHGSVITLEQGVTSAELWCWSGAWLAMGAGALVIGFRRQWAGTRMAGLGLIALVTIKVFVIDMSALDDLWRVRSFLGLGLGLIALGAVYRRMATKPEA